MQFQQISRDDLNGKLRDDSAIYKVIPAFRNKNQVNAKAIYLTEEKKTRPTSRVDFVPKLSCDTISPKEMGNQSGMSTLKVHQETCSKNESRTIMCTLQPLIDNALIAIKPRETRKPLPVKMKKMWRYEVVGHLSENPTIYINLRAKLAPAHANYAACVTFKTNSLYNWNIGRTYITGGM